MLTWFGTIVCWFILCVPVQCPVSDVLMLLLVYVLLLFASADDSTSQSSPCHILVHHSIDSNFLDTLHFLQTRLEDKTEESFEVHCKVILLAVRVNNCRLQYFFILATMAVRFTSNIIRFAFLVTMSAMIQRTMCTSLKMMDSRACFGAGKSFNRTFWNACIRIISCKTNWTLRSKCSSSAGCYWGTGMITSNCHWALDNYTEKKLPFSIKCNDFHCLSAN